jgi:protein involved in ribonucleotide reduction
MTCDRWWFSHGTLVSSINKTDRHNITEILLKVVLNTIILTLKYVYILQTFSFGVSQNILQVRKLQTTSFIPSEKNKQIIIYS